MPRPDTGLAALLLLAGTITLGYFTEQVDFFRLLAAYLPMFGAYFYLLRRTDEKSWHWLMTLGIVLRLALLFAVPGLSDDVYRFIWDGRLLVQGYNPFAELPGHYLQLGNQVPGLDSELFQKLNSPEYFTIYPPLAQASFALACWLFPDSMYGSIVVMKALLIGFEIGNCILLPRVLHQFGLPAKNALLYLLNPLLIIELSGNLHHEGMMIFFLLLSLQLLMRGRVGFAALAYAGSIGAKLLTTMFLPLYLRRLSWGQVVFFYLFTGFTTILLFTPLFNEVFLDSFRSSIDLYFQRFEFNASIFYIIRWYGFETYGYDVVQWAGPRLAALVVFFVGVVVIADINRSLEALPGRMLLVFTLYLLLATTVHPWYLAMLIALCCFTRFRYPVVWSMLIPLTYINYSYQAYYEPLGIVALEYILLYAVLLLELLGKKVNALLGT